MASSKLVQAACLREYKVYLAFDDGVSGVVDMAEKAQRGGVFAPLADTRYFRQMRLDASLGTICWPNGADIAPETLKEMVLCSPLNSMATISAS